jgi:hypothetical protein
VAGAKRLQADPLNEDELEFAELERQLRWRFGVCGVRPDACTEYLNKEVCGTSWNGRRQGDVTRCLHGADSGSMLGMRGIIGRDSGSERCWRTVRTQDRGSNPKTRSSWLQRQAFASRAAHWTAFSREGSSSTVKPPLSGGAHE